MRAMTVKTNSFLTVGLRPFLIKGAVSLSFICCTQSMKILKIFLKNVICQEFLIITFFQKNDISFYVKLILSHFSFKFKLNLNLKYLLFIKTKTWEIPAIVKKNSYEELVIMFKRKLIILIWAKYTRYNRVTYSKEEKPYR